MGFDSEKTTKHYFCHQKDTVALYGSQEDYLALFWLPKRLLRSCFGSQKNTKAYFCSQEDYLAHDLVGFSSKKTIKHYFCSKEDIVAHVLAP